MLPSKSTSKELTQYSKEEYQNAIERILQHKQSTLKFQATLSSADNVILSGDYTLGRISHNYFSNCVFQNASLKKVAGAGAIFSNVKFINTDLSSAGFHSGAIEHCEFRDCHMESSNFGQSYIANTSWEDCYMGGMNIASSHLKDCSMIHCISNPGNLSDSCFDNVHFKNIRLTNLNLEFAHFKKVSMENVILPFSQMPYIFGGLFYLMETNDPIKISSHINKEDCIDVDEYIQVLHDMEVFYSYRQEYFPLANILLAFHRSREALTAILCGIVDSASQKDFRMCKYFCKLITEYGNCTSNQLQTLYNALIQAAPVHKLSESQYYQYNCHMPAIRSMLIENPRSFPHGTLSLHTNIETIESEQLPMILECIDSFLHLDYCILEQPNIAISHNSPVILVIGLCGNPLTILTVSSLILSTVVAICKSYNVIAQSIISTQTIKKNSQELKKNKLEEQKLQAELTRLQLENIELQAKVSQRRQLLTDSGIIISHAEMTACDFNPYKWI